MARRVYLHVGAPKAGSTYVQHVLWGNRLALKRAGLLLPGTSKAHDHAMTDLREVSWRDPDADWTWDRLAAKARAWTGDVIISNEGLSGATPEQAARAVESLQPAEVHVIVAGRDLWRALPSMWQQSIRSRSKWSFEAFLSAVEQGKIDFWEYQTPNRMLRRWGDLVAPEQRHLITVPPAGTPHDTLWQRFAGVLGIPDGVCDLGTPKSNPSLGAAEVEVLRRVNAALGSSYPHRTPYQRVVQRHLVDAVLKKGGNELRFGVGLDRASWVLDQAERQITELREYPCDIVGDLAELRPAIVERTLTPDELDEKQVTATAIDTIIGLLRHVEDLSRQANRRPDKVLAQFKDRAVRSIGALRRQPPSAD